MSTIATPESSTTTLKPGDEVHGFKVKRVVPLKNLRSTAFELEHIRTGARLLHLFNNDSENLFCIGFPTPPSDDTGLPHILEHSVLGGSKKYPVKDPFFEMVKMSMATFINAMTYDDKTVYPVASNVKQDFYNLAEVYCDAVFHPRLRETTFKQEGHHLEFSTKTDPSTDLIIKGIVYNEMKGAYSSADSLAAKYSSAGLFPDTAYGRDSGGDPERIPELTYEQFTAFHAEYYHPSNAYIFLYGDLPTVEHLAFLEERLRSFERRNCKIALPYQPRWPKPLVDRKTYPIGREDEVENRTFLTINWIVGDGTHARDVMCFELLEMILLGNEGAPLRTALIDSKLGEDLSYSGFSSSHLESTFHIGLKGSEAKSEEAFVKLVLETLTSIAKKGIAREHVDTAFQQLAYHYLEISSMFPLRLMDRAFVTWIYGADPLLFLRADEILEGIRKDYEKDPELFSRLIMERLVQNLHRLTVVCVPDREMVARKDAEFATEMARKKTTLTPAQIQTIVREAQELEELQNTPNSAEALATLPQLRVTDLPSKPREIPTSIEKIAGIECLKNDVFANGVNYLALNINLEGMPEDLLPYLSLYRDCVGKMGAAGFDYVETAERVAAHTGGIGFYASCSSHVQDPSRSLRWGRFSLKALDGKMEEAMRVFSDLLFKLEPTDKDRLRDVLTQAKAGHRSALVHNGVNLALCHAGRDLNPQTWLSEIMGGLPQVRLIQTLADDFDAHVDKIISRLESIRDFMLSRGRFTLSFTGSGVAAEKMHRAVETWSGQLRVDAVQQKPLSFQTRPTWHREGLAAPMDVAFCAQVIPAPHISHPDSPLLAIGGRLLRHDYMLEEIRVKGGAYGASCGHSGLEETWHYYSYRDPWVKKTLDIFEGLKSHVQEAAWSQTEIDRSIIGTAKDGERPIRPAAATDAALSRHIMGDTSQLRAARHSALLRATPKEVKRAVLSVLETHAERGGVCVVSSREKLEKANEEMDGKKLMIEEIMK